MYSTEFSFAQPTFNIFNVRGNFHHILLGYQQSISSCCFTINDIIGINYQCTLPGSNKELSFFHLNKFRGFIPNCRITRKKVTLLLITNFQCTEIQDHNTTRQDDLTRQIEIHITHRHSIRKAERLRQGMIIRSPDCKRWDD